MILIILGKKRAWAGQPISGELIAFCGRWEGFGGDRGGIRRRLREQLDRSSTQQIITNMSIN